MTWRWLCLAEISSEWPVTVFITTSWVDWTFKSERLASETLSRHSGMYTPVSRSVEVLLDIAS